MIGNAVDLLRQGRVVIYPTETLYAVGCLGSSAKACNRVARIKGRPEAKPLPLIVGRLEDIDLVTAQVPEELPDLARAFWPGPLSVLVRARAKLPAAVKDADGFTSVRFTVHPTAQMLCRMVGAPLVATSANRSGMPPTARPQRLDPGLIDDVDAAVLDRPWPGGGLASTVVRILPGRTLAILRQGAVSDRALADQGFRVVHAETL